jgi:DNA-binding GntR family transcriptional regulator
MGMDASTQLRELRRFSVADQVASVLRERILAGELRPGTPLLEIPLASSLRVSRNTMREAMKVLSLEGLLTRSVHRGVAVAQLGGRDISEIYQLRRMLELSAVHAAKRPQREHLEQLKNLVEQYEAAARTGEWTSAVAFDLHFHVLLVQFHNNRRLEAFYQKLLRELRVGMVLVDRGMDDPGRLIRVHRKIYRLLAAGELRECAAALAEHLDDSEERINKIVSERASARKGSEHGSLSSSAESEEALARAVEESCQIGR